jgi:asparagine synthase (glutamine-hydrolysing)
MCGIAGFFSADRVINRDLIRSMTDRIAHRGPDDSGVFCDEFVALGFRRLSIIDVAGGHQPMGNEDGRLQIIYNGEIFNHADLRPPLEAAGHLYRTRCDTETIVHSYEQYGEECVTRFRGMFAFAIWDKQARTLFCARDRLGIKPFYYWTDGVTFVFASEIKALLVHPVVRAEFDDAGLAEYLAFGYLSGERTMFRGIRKLMPGHTVKVELSSSRQLVITQKQYWDVPPPAAPGPARDDQSRDDQSWITECRQRVEETIRMRLMSDVPLGMFLSGGIDSSTIAALMKRMVPDQKIKTFSVGYRESEYSELGFARELAAEINTDHHEITVGMDEFFNKLPSLIWHEDEPVVWPSSVSLYFVSKLASQEVKVVLTGEGADELFAGYGRYQYYAMNERYAGMYGKVPEWVRKPIRSLIASSALLPADLRRKAQHTFVGRELTFESLFLDNFYSAFSAEDQKGLAKHAANPDSAYAAYMSYRHQRDSADPLTRLLYADQKTYLVELLMKQDQMSMACSIESRVPFLDHPLVEFAAQVPAHLKIRDGKGKYILRKAVEDLLPQTTLTRKKMGFPTPLKNWLLDPKANPLYAKLLEPQGFIASYLDMSRVKTLIEQHRSHKIDATDRIWRLLNLQYWGEIFLSGRGQWHDLPASTHGLSALP